MGLSEYLTLSFSSKPSSVSHNLTASDRVGKMLTCAVLLVTVSGAKVLAEFNVKSNRLLQISSKKEKRRGRTVPESMPG